MTQRAMRVSGVMTFLAYMIKDAGAYCALQANKLRSDRDYYPVMHHLNIRAYNNVLPWTQDAAFIAPNALVCGNVALGHDTCVFYHTVVRNFNCKQRTVIGDHTVLLERVTFTGQVRVGNNTYIGTGATLDTCEVDDNVYIGPCASVALGAVVERNAIVAAGASVEKDARVHSGELWAGNPAQKVADVTSEQAHELNCLVHRHVHLGKAHAAAIEAHATRNSSFDEKWLRDVMAKVEAQQRQVSVKLPVDLPPEAMPFVEPRVHVRRPDMRMHASSEVSEFAPWLDTTD